MITRADYLAQRATYAEYYGEIIQKTGLRCPAHLVERARASTDPHFNDVPLHLWDQSMPVWPHHLAAAIRARGDYPTLAGWVCLMKEAARLEIADKPSV